MRQNAARRTLLLDAAIEILAREGARGLTYRALDAEADLPTGTSSNYFRNRYELLRQAGEHVHVRLQPDPLWLGQTLNLAAGPALMTALLQNLVGRVLANRSAYLALLELRLAATRHPDLQATLSGTIQANLQRDFLFSQQHFGASEPDFMVMYLALSGLLIEELTLPKTLELTPEEMVKAILERCWPQN